MEDKKISVIVPVYNAEKFLNRCVESILNQTYKNIELILVNDGSKDNSLSICQKFAGQDERVIVVDKPNGGAASARNKGLDCASGDYIGFCDADDFLDPEMYSTLIKVLEDNDLDMVDSLSKVYDEEENFLYSDENSRELKIVPSTEYIKSIFLRKGNVSLCSRLFRASHIKQIRISEGRRVEDFYFIIECLVKTKKNATYCYPFYNYVSTSTSVTHKATGSIYLDALYFYDLAVKLLKNYPISFEEEKIYYLLKMYYLLFISVTKQERKIYKKELKLCKENLKLYKKQIKTNQYLAKKEKIMLKISCFSTKLTRFLFVIKNRGKK